MVKIVLAPVGLSPSYFGHKFLGFVFYGHCSVVYFDTWLRMNVNYDSVYEVIKFRKWNFIHINLMSIFIILCIVCILCNVLKPILTL